MLDNRKAKNILFIVATIIIAVFLLVSTVKNYTSNVDETLYNASTQNLREVYGQLNQKFITIAQMQWNQLRMSADFIAEADGDMDGIRSYLNRWHDEWKYNEFYFLNTDSSYRCMDGTEGYIMTGSAWKTLALERENVIFDGSMPGGEELTFFASPVEPGEVDGFSYFAVAVAYDTEALSRELGVSAYDGNASSYMIYENGDIAFMAENSTDIGSNVLYYTKKAEYKRSSYEEVARNIANGKEGQAECEINGLDYYVAYQPVGIQNLTLVSIVPAVIANSSDMDIQTFTVSMLTYVFIVLALLIGMALMVYIRYKARMKDSELAWRTILSDVMVQNMDSVYALWDMDSHATKYISPNIEKILGIPADVNAHPLKSIVALEKDESTMWVMELRKIPEGGSITRECMITPLNGDRQPRLFQKTAYHVMRGGNDMLIFEFADRSREQKVRLQIEDALNAATLANHAKSDFLANMSHDIRTPMNAIMGMTTLLEHNADSPARVREYVGKIKASSQQLLNIINDVLDMSKIESGKTVLNNGEFNIAEVIEQVENMFRPQTDARRQTFIVRMPVFVRPYLVGDSVRIVQILNNILSNAVKYTPVGGRIIFEIDEIPHDTRNYNKLIFRISDTGIGMSREYLSHIFESFTREERSVTNAIQGTGLGMAIVKNLVDLMGGLIQVESEQGKGTTFEVMLDFKTASREEQGNIGMSADTGSLDDVSLEGIKFLCAEDNELNAEILTELLHMEGAQCKICVNGSFVVDEFERSKPGDYDIILMDVQMPIMDGYEATRAIRSGANPLGRSIPIFAMTANAFSDDIQRSYDAGMNAHISKPVDLNRLKEAVKKAGIDGRRSDKS